MEKDSKEMVAIVHGKRNSGLDMGGDHTERNILAMELLCA